MLDKDQMTAWRLQPAGRPLAILSCLHFLNDGAANFLPGLLPLMLVTLHESAGLAGILMAALLMGQALQPLFGLWADRLGGRGLVVAGFLGTAIGMGLVGVSTHFALLLWALALIGISNAAFHPQALAMARSFEQNGPKGHAISVFLVGGELGRGLSPWLVTWIVAGIGMLHLWVLSVLSCVSLLIAFPSIPRLPARSVHAEPLTLRGKGAPLSALVAFAGLRSTVTYGVITFLPLLWVADGGSKRNGALLIVAVIVSGILGNMGGPRIAARIGRARVLFYALLATGVLLGLVLLLPWAVDWALLVVLGVALFAPIALTVAIGQDLFPENRSLGAGLALGSANGLGAVAMVVLGALAEAYGLRFTLACVAVLALCASLLAKTWPDTHSASAA